jgi:hypothetical protein
VPIRTRLALALRVRPQLVQAAFAASRRAHRTRPTEAAA